MLCTPLGSTLKLNDVANITGSFGLSKVQFSHYNNFLILIPIILCN